ncbi:MAG: energy transducer TonB [Gammaproteobacteria bacterium]|nr:MAG: energy transducer TonB [Gammaproteobacteria bacterium]
MQPVTLQPKITARDRLTMTIIVAVLFHAMLIFGVVFETLIKKDTRKSLPALDITLVAPDSSKLPNKADYLAQANQNSDQEKPQEHLTPEESASLSNATQDNASSEALSNQEASRDPLQGQEIDAVATKESSMFVQKSSVLEQKHDLISDSLDFVKKQSEARDPNKKLTHKYINVRSKRDVEAAYWAKWSKHIETVGNANISDEVFLKNLSGDVKTDISLNPDGSVYDFKIVSSDNPLLTEEVKKIIRLAAPFEPISKEVMGGADILHIERIWRFGE